MYIQKMIILTLYCYDLKVTGVRDSSLIKRGQVAVFQLPDINLEKSTIEYVQLKGNIANGFKPSCLALHFEGEPQFITSSNLAYSIEVPASCSLLSSDPNRSTCFPEKNFVLLNAEFNREIPQFEVQIIDLEDEIQANWVIKKTDLE